MSSSEQLPGVAALADRPVDGRRVAFVMSAVGVVLGVASLLGVERLLASANEEGPAGSVLRTLPAPAAPLGPPGRVAIVLVDGMRVDEAQALPSVRALASSTATGVIRLPTPTLSRPFYHLLFTGVPPHTSGVRTNRFAGRARHASVPERVREAGGRVVLVAEGLDWMRTMHGQPGDGGADDHGSVEPARLDATLRALRDAPAPTLALIHVTSTDHTAHAEGIHAPAHRAALARADAVIARVAAEDLTLVVLSDHGHLERGGHGGPEPEVARAPLVVRAAGLEAGARDEPVDATQLAATLAALLGVPAPAHATGAPAPTFLPPGHPATAPSTHHARLATLARHGERMARASLDSRHGVSLPLALLLAAMALGTVKRAFGFDRGVAVAILGWPALVVGAHLALGRPLSLSAIDTMEGHGARVAALGAGAALVGIALAWLTARGPQRVRRVAASTGWSAAACALLASSWVGFAFGPWPLSPLETYVPLLALGAAAAALPVAALTLLVSGLVAAPSEPSEPSEREPSESSKREPGP